VRIPCIDLHLHLLPGVDDGPPDLETSVRFAADVAASGVEEATVTPHVGHPWFELDVAGIPRRTRELQSAIDRAGIRLRLRPGGELHPRGVFSLGAEELATVAQGPPHARWVLLEVPFDGIDEGFLAACDHVRAHGYGILIGHPERAAGLLDGGLRLLRRELLRGAVLQVNVDSLRGDHGEQPRVAAEWLVRSGVAYVVASDGHSGKRNQTLGEAFALVRATGASAVRARQLARANPAFLLQQGIPAPEPVPAESARRGADARRVAAAREAARRLRRAHATARR
jgi:protein-tyrosine phosphatase